MSLELEVHEGPASAARRAGELVAGRAHAAFALSKAPPEMLRAIAGAGLAWDSVDVYQVDERIAPAGHADRNLTHLLAGLPAEARESVHAMPVEAGDLEDAAAAYAAALPELDVVHLGLGTDGHTASLLPDDPVLDVRDRLAAVTGEYQGRRRMTITYPALEAAGEIVWLVTGEAKREILARLLAGDRSLPAARIENPRQLVVTDGAARPG